MTRSRGNNRSSRHPPRQALPHAECQEHLATLRSKRSTSNPATDRSLHRKQYAYGETLESPVERRNSSNQLWSSATQPSCASSASCVPNPRFASPHSRIGPSSTPFSSFTSSRRTSFQLQHPILVVPVTPFHPHTTVHHRRRQERTTQRAPLDVRARRPYAGRS